MSSGCEPRGECEWAGEGRGKRGACWLIDFPAAAQLQLQKQFHVLLQLQLPILVTVARVDVWLLFVESDVLSPMYTCHKAHTHTHTHSYSGSGNWQQMITKLATKSGANLILMPSTTLSCCCGATLIWLPQIRLAGAIWGLPFPLLLFFLLLLLVACAIWRLWAGLVTSSQDWDEGDDEEEETKLAKCLYNPELLTALTSIDFWRRQWWCALSGCCILFPHSCYLWIWNEISEVITVNRVLCLFTICEKTEKNKKRSSAFFRWLGKFIERRERERGGEQRKDKEREFT